MNGTKEDISILEHFETSVCHIYRRSDDVVKIEIKEDAEIDIAESREMFEIIKSLSKSRKDLLVLVITSKSSSVTKEVREFSGTEEASEPTLAEAIVTTSLPQKIVVNFIIKFHKPKRFMKMFNDEEEAVRWLYSFK